MWSSVAKIPRNNGKAVKSIPFAIITLGCEKRLKQKLKCQSGRFKSPGIGFQKNEENFHIEDFDLQEAL